jgi:hypothetical protein
MDDNNVQSESDNPQDLRPDHELESTLTDPDRLPEGPPLENETGSSPERPHRRKGLTGGYYWFPTPATNGISWSVVTCRDLRCSPDAGHDADRRPGADRRLVPAGVWTVPGRTGRGPRVLIEADFRRDCPFFQNPGWISPARRMLFDRAVHGRVAQIEEKADRHGFWGGATMLT